AHQNAKHFGRGNLVPKQKLFRKNLAAFKLRCNLRRSNDRQIASAKCVRNTVYKRKLWTDDCQVWPDLFCKRGKCAYITRVDCYAFCLCGNSSIARSAPDFLN